MHTLTAVWHSDRDPASSSTARTKNKNKCRRKHSVCVCVCVCAHLTLPLSTCQMRTSPSTLVDASMSSCLLKATQVTASEAKPKRTRENAKHRRERRHLASRHATSVDKSQQIRACVCHQLVLFEAALDVPEAHGLVERAAGKQIRLQRECDRRNVVGVAQKRFDERFLCAWLLSRNKNATTARTQQRKRQTHETRKTIQQTANSRPYSTRPTA